MYICKIGKQNRQGPITDWKSVGPRKGFRFEYDAFRHIGEIMKEIKVNKYALREKLVSNREAHVKEFNEAHAAWVEAQIENHKAQIKSLKEKGKNASFDFGAEPASEEKSYDRVIQMLDMSIDDAFTLTETEFSQYVMDEWSWSPVFKMTNSTYLSK